MNDNWLLPEFRKDQRILLIGAGGIGCEALKNLTLCGFRKFTVIDLDSIDISNLNRQFLFRKSDVGKPKALVATEAARRYCQEDADDFSVTIHQCKVQELPIDVLSKHDIILNALDNFDARRYVNRVAVGLDMPIIESGSTGHNGQAFVIWSAAETECFDCRDHPKPQSFPVCTVRLTPEKPEHCVAWARYLLEMLFGPSDELGDNLLSDMKSSIENSTNQSPVSFAKTLAQKLFISDIEDLLKTQEFRGHDIKPPKPLSAPENDMTELGEGKYMSSPNASEARDVWDIEKNWLAFLDAAAWLKKHCDGKALKFEKDDDQLMAFVGAAANLRMANYHIPMQSLWDCKSIAGSIQPAIAATNAIVAGIQVDLMLRVLKIKRDFGEKKPTREDLNSRGIRFMWVRGTPTGNYLLAPEKLEPPNPRCFICQQKRVRIVLKSLEDWTIQDFLNRILKDGLDCRGDVFLQSASSVIYDPDIAEDDPKLLTKTLNESGIISGELLSLTASGEQFVSFDIIIQVAPDEFKDYLPEDFGHKIERANDIESGALMDSTAFKDQSAPTAHLDLSEDDEVEVVQSGNTKSSTTTNSPVEQHKRRQDENDEATVAKKRRVTA